MHMSIAKQGSGVGGGPGLDRGQASLEFESFPLNGLRQRALPQGHPRTHSFTIGTDFLPEVGSPRTYSDRSYHVVAKRTKRCLRLRRDQSGHTAMKMPNGPLGSARDGTVAPNNRYRSIGEMTIEQDSSPSVNAGSLHRPSGTTTDLQD